jgi:hypothetical protein
VPGTNDGMERQPPLAVRKAAEGTDIRLRGEEIRGPADVSRAYLVNLAAACGQSVLWPLRRSALSG